MKKTIKAIVEKACEEHSNTSFVFIVNTDTDPPKESTLPCGCILFNSFNYITFLLRSEFEEMTGYETTPGETFEIDFQ
jgi:hypothetical protein